MAKIRWVSITVKLKLLPLASTIKISDIYNTSVTAVVLLLLVLSSGWAEISPDWGCSIDTTDRKLSCGIVLLIGSAVGASSILMLWANLFTTCCELSPLDVVVTLLRGNIWPLELGLLVPMWSSSMTVAITAFEMNYKR